MTESVIETDGATVWVHSHEGMTIGRFSRRGIDVHTATADGCLDCAPGPCGLAEWRRFQAGMRHFHGVDVADTFMPNYLKEDAP